MEFATLKDLFDAIKSGTQELHEDLPTFGGDWPNDTREVWSWDKRSLIVGRCVDELQIVPRDDHPRDND